MNQLIIDTGLLSEQKKELVNLMWGLPEQGKLHDALQGVVNFLDMIGDEVEKHDSVEIIKSEL